MLSNEELEQKLNVIDEVFYVKVDGDGYHYQVIVVSDVFLKKSKVARQQWVYAQLRDLITAGKLHAINMQTWTKEEWGTQGGQIIN